jgi:hypothetical protein
MEEANVTLFRHLISNKLMREIRFYYYKKNNEALVNLNLESFHSLVLFIIDHNARKQKPVSFMSLRYVL